MIDEQKLKKIYESANMVLSNAPTEEDSEDLDIIERKVRRSHKIAERIIDMVNAEVSSDLDKILIARSISLGLLSGIRQLSLELEERNAMLCLYHASKKALKMVGYYDNGGFDALVRKPLNRDEEGKEEGEEAAILD